MVQLLTLKEIKSCPKSYVMAVNEALTVFQGKWKMPIIGSLMFGKQRFRELERSIPKITSRMLSKELKELELNGVVKRTVLNTIPVTVTYELTESGYTLKKVVEAMIVWGMQHRESNSTNKKAV